jgi:hypothetical protein
MSILLKINHYLFKWYYRRVDKHFHQWTILKSISLLIQHYEHEQLLHRNANANFKNAIKELDSIRSELSNLKMQQVATDSQIRGLNRAFGTNFTPPTDN